MRPPRPRWPSTSSSDPSRFGIGLVRRKSSGPPSVPWPSTSDPSMFGIGLVRRKSSGPPSARGGSYFVLALWPSVSFVSMKSPPVPGRPSPNTLLLPWSLVPMSSLPRCLRILSSVTTCTELYGGCPAPRDAAVHRRGVASATPSGDPDPLERQERSLEAKRGLDAAPCRRAVPAQASVRCDHPVAGDEEPHGVPPDG